MTAEALGLSRPAEVVVRADQPGADTGHRHSDGAGPRRAQPALGRRHPAEQSPATAIGPSARVTGCAGMVQPDPAGSAAGRRGQRLPPAGWPGRPPAAAVDPGGWPPAQRGHASAHRQRRQRGVRPGQRPVVPALAAEQLLLTGQDRRGHAAAQVGDVDGAQRMLPGWGRSGPPARRCPRSARCWGRPAPPRRGP